MKLWTSEGPRVSRRWHALKARIQPPGAPMLGSYASYHLTRKGAAREASPRWLHCVALHLREAVRFFGASRPLETIRVRDVADWEEHLLVRANGRGGVLSGHTVNHYVHSLSDVFERARAEELVHDNPVRLRRRRPPQDPSEVPWLEAPEVRRILASARTDPPARPDLAVPFIHELVALFAYTGVRKREGLGLELRDLSFERGVILVRPNRWRRLKGRHATRPVPLFSELARILEAYLDGPHAPTGALLFPSPAAPDGAERPLQNVCRSLDRLPMPERLNLPPERPGEPSPGPPLRLGILRHTYCAARLQTLDHGQPIAPVTVAREMGHGDLSMVWRVYGHLGTVRHRGEEVSYACGRNLP